MCALSRLVTGSAGSTGQRYTVPASNRRNGGTDVFSEMRDGSSVSPDAKLNDNDLLSGNSIDSLPSDWFNGSNGSKGSSSSSSSPDEYDNYASIYEMMKHYPQWLALLDANPYKGLNVPESLFDKIGLSNKAKDKMLALKQEYLNYNAQILANFLNWYNSLPTTQREQLNEAGYASDLANVAASQLPSDIPQGSNALQMPSGNTADDLLNVVGTAASLFTTGTSVALGVMTTLSSIDLQKSQKQNIDKSTENLGKTGEGIDLANFSSSLDAAKRIYSNLAPRLSKPKDPNEIMASFSMQYPDAPDSVNKALKNYVNSREFQEGLNQAETKVIDSDSAFNQSFMTNSDLRLLVGSPEYWLGIRKLSNETYMKQMKEINEYLDTLDTVTQVRSSNAYYNYIMQYYNELTTLGVPSLSAQAAFMQNKAAISTYDMQKSYAERNRSVLESQNKRMQEYFDVLTSDTASEWEKFWAASFLLSNSFLTRVTDPSANNGTAVAPFSPVGMSQPSFPFFSLPIMK